MNCVLENGDFAFTKFFEGLIANGQPFLGELLESEGNVVWNDVIARSNIDLAARSYLSSIVKKMKKNHAHLFFYRIERASESILITSCLIKPICLDKRVSDSTADATERFVLDDEMLKKCPGLDKLRADTREKLKTYLQDQVDQHLSSFTEREKQRRCIDVLVGQSLFERNMENTESRQIRRIDQFETTTLRYAT